MTDARTAFGAWLVAQDKRSDWVGDFAKVARADRRFPREGDPAAVREWLMQQRASGDDWEALDHAENDWLCI